MVSSKLNMGRMKSNPAHEYFVYNKECKKSTCTVCNVGLMGNHGKNLERHIESVHPEIQKVVEEKREKQKMANTTNSTCSTQTGKQIKYTQSQLTDFKTSINIKMTKKTLINACVELVTVNGRPFSLMNNSGFKAIIDPIVNGLKNKKFKINSKNIKAEVIEEAEIVRNDIISSIKNHLVSIKVDVATRLERSFLGINVQFIKDGQIHLKTLAVLEITQAHTSDHLKKLILDVCSKYEIRKSQLYTITTDNGANMIKAVKLLPMEDYDSDSDDSIENLSEDSNDEELLEDKIEKHLSGIESSFSINESEDCFLRGIRCAAHTLQLAIEDALRKVQSENGIISVARVVAKKLRTQALINFIRKCKLKKPILDCPTRWSSKHDMLLRLLELKDFCNDFAENYPIILLSETQWAEMQEICDCLRPAKILSKRLQAENLTLSGFYSSWLTCKMEIKGKKCAFALLLHECMESRERLILKNDVLLSAVFLDPRFKVMLSESEITRAIAHLEDLWNYVSYTSVTTNINVSDSDSFQKSTSSTDASTDDILEEILKLKEKRVEEHYKRSSTMSIKSILQSYNSNQKRLSRKTDVIAFWESMSKTMSELYELAKIIFAVPATQVSVERLFSNLKFILSSQRANMKDSIIEDVLVVRANKMFASKKKSCDMLSVPINVQEKTLHKNNRTQCTPCELQKCVSDKPLAIRQPTVNLKRIAPTDSSHAIDNKIKKYGYIVNVE